MAQELEGGTGAAMARLAGKQVAMVMYSSYPSDPRPRRAVEALLKEGMTVDLICLSDGANPSRERSGNFDIVRIPLTHTRGGKLSYAYKYSAFIFAAGAILADVRLKRRYDLVYVHNMPDVLVASALVPKMLGAKVILDQHDPMPELMTTIFESRSEESRRPAIGLAGKVEHRPRRSRYHGECRMQTHLQLAELLPRKDRVVMNTPDEKIFPFKPWTSFVRRPTRLANVS